MIDYEMAGQAIQNSLLACQCWVAKTAAQFLPYGTNMKQWNQQEEDRCPQCHQPAELKNHLTQCQAPSTIEQWNNSRVNKSEVACEQDTLGWDLALEGAI